MSKRLGRQEFAGSRCRDPVAIGNHAAFARPGAEGEGAGRHRRRPAAGRRIRVFLPPARTAINGRSRARSLIGQQNPTRNPARAPGTLVDESYVEYWRLQPDLKNDIDPATSVLSCTRNEGSYIAEKMRGDWLKQLGKKQQWAEFDAEYPALCSRTRN
jgi:hypothetical protein